MSEEKDITSLAKDEQNSSDKTVSTKTLQNEKSNEKSKNSVPEKIRRLAARNVEKLLFNITKSMPFYASILSRFIREISIEIPVAAVMFKRAYPVLLVNPKGLFHYSLREQTFILIHEIMHITHMHHFRRKGKDPGVWNIACDIEINQLIESSFAYRPNDALMPHHYDLPELLSAEEYYNLLMAKEDIIKVPEDLMNSLLDEIVNGSGSGSESDNEESDSEGDQEGDSDSQGNDGETDSKAPGFENLHPQWEEMAKEDQDLHKGLVKEIISEAINKSVGNIPGEMTQIIDELFEPKLDSGRLLNTFATSITSSKKRYTWSRPNRRHGNIKMGSIRTKKSSLIFAIDTSMSLNMDELTQFLSEIEHINKTNDVDITVVQCDTKIQSVEKWEDIDVHNFTVRGRGGTSFLPVFDLIENMEYGDFTLNTKPDGIVYLTDGGGEAPLDSDIRTAWVISPGGRIPYDRNGNEIDWGINIYLDQ